VERLAFGVRRGSYAGGTAGDGTGILERDRDTGLKIRVIARGKKLWLTTGFFNIILYITV
jgi:hypothetical protein